MHLFFRKAEFSSETMDYMRVKIRISSESMKPYSFNTD